MGGTITINDTPRLIEIAFPLKQASLDSVHEKNVRHGHISTLHIWPARRPLAACRAALIATLLPDPGNPEDRKKLLEKLGGKIVSAFKKKKLPNGSIEETSVEATEGGILHWGRESSPDLEWFRQEIRKVYGGRAPKVLDPFAGGGAIPLEAARLGCQATAIDINPVAWFILKCTLEYPQKLAGQLRPLPQFALDSPEFMATYFKNSSPKKLNKKQLERSLEGVQLGLFPAPDVDLAWHVRAWGWWVLQQAKADLDRFYPLVDGKPTVAYLWARTVRCKNCRATVPMLKTRWLCKKDKKRVLLTMEPNPEKEGVVFGIQADVPVVGGNNAHRREHDQRIGSGTMSKSGSKCPCCGSIMTMDDIRQEGRVGKLGSQMIAVVVDGANGKEYRLPTEDEIRLASVAAPELEKVYEEIPFGLPQEPITEALGVRVVKYGFDSFDKLFSHRQLLAIATFIQKTRSLRQVMQEAGYEPLWIEAVQAYLSVAIDKLADRSSEISTWDNGCEKMRNTFARFALPITWDFAEVLPQSETSGGYMGAIEWTHLFLKHALEANSGSNLLKDLSAPNQNNGADRPLNNQVIRASSTKNHVRDVDVIITDPPYYDAIGYSVSMDFFYVWLRRCLHGLTDEINNAFPDPVAPKWDHAANDGELIDDSSRFAGDKSKSKTAYEDGMFRAFQACHQALRDEGRLVIVFASKSPVAWETLVSAIIRAGFIVDASWPIQTEMLNRTRALASAALSSSVWLVCKKRSSRARPGWDNRVLAEMQNNITTKLRAFWDAGIRGPDFVWAATGPALEAYSQHPVVKKANEPGQILTIQQFLGHVRRIVVDFVVGRVLSETTNTAEAATGLDDLTAYYLLHRHDFGMKEAPSGACILYAISCGLQDKDLGDRFDLLSRSGKTSQDDDSGDLDEDTDSSGGGSKVKLKPWQQRKRKSMGYEAPSGYPVPLIDQIHRLLHLWQAGDVNKVNDYLDSRGLRRSTLFYQLLQSLIELAPSGSDERSYLESISNHVNVLGRGSNVVQPSLLGQE